MARPEPMPPVDPFDKYRLSPLDSDRQAREFAKDRIVQRLRKSEDDARKAREAAEQENKQALAAAKEAARQAAEHKVEQERIKKLHPDLFRGPRDLKRK